ncbi:unnamed protein product [marine sediment metagenome]|uniref:Uncharacterized protein n=1 Tax=marine sediment metagenome TaxID=412755 RepID=X0YJK3_9ZZZZ
MNELEHTVKVEVAEWFMKQDKMGLICQGEHKWKIIRLLHNKGEIEMKVGTVRECQVCSRQEYFADVNRGKEVWDRQYYQIKEE